MSKTEQLTKSLQTGESNPTPMQQVGDLLASQKHAIAQVLPKTVTPERLLQVVFNACRQTPKLLECDSNSLIGGVIQCAQLGLEPNTSRGLCYLIPFGGIVQFVMGYRGMVDLCLRSGKIQSVYAAAVYKDDDFDFQRGTKAFLHHRPLGEKWNCPTEIQAFYAVAELTNGGRPFEVWTAERVWDLRDRYSKTRSDSPWRTEPEKMGAKTMVRQLFPFLPQSVEMAQAERLDALADANLDQGLSSIVSGFPGLDLASIEIPTNAQDGPQGGEDGGKSDESWPKQDHVDGRAVWTDANGEVFDPDHHASRDSDGERIPVCNQDGSFRKRRGTK